jgi:hypothetical protein
MSGILKLEYTVRPDICVLSSESAIRKTERFIRETRRFADMDSFLCKIAEGLMLRLPAIDFSKEARSSADCYRLEAADGEQIFYFKLGFSLHNGLRVAQKDIVFFRYADKENSGRRNDQTFAAYLRAKKPFGVRIFADKLLSDSSDFNKLYTLSFADQVNFPLLNAEQIAIVETEDKNVLVQGVAGSGKTNICISKLVFTACRDYTGRTLYTTYSRGLLLDTRAKTEAFCQNLKTFLRDYSEGRVVFADRDHKKAIENRFTMTFPEQDENKLIARMRAIADYLEHKVDYFLIEDLYNKYVGRAEAVDENYFIKKYVKNIKNHQLTGKLARVNHLSHEVIFKEIYGMISGCCNPAEPQKTLSLEDYIAKREDSFNRSECEIIYSLAKDYMQHLVSSGLSDNNLMSRRLLAEADSLPKYSLAIIDEVQDMTEISLCLMKALSRKLFCVGDALQMINPSYFSFAYLKNLLFEKDAATIAELRNNYRNTKRIAEIIDKLGALNIGRFGTHSFVLKSESIEADSDTSLIFVPDDGFLAAASKENFDHFTVIVSGNKQKEELRKLLKRQEILTVSEIKGLERETVVLWHLLSDNADKWSALERTTLNRKRADENSVYRYYFNLFYVGASRAKNHLFVTETASIPLFERFFQENFLFLPLSDAVKKLGEVVAKIEIAPEELIERVGQFINLGQYDNARFAANKIQDDLERTLQLDRIDVFEKFISHGKYREAGIRYWELGRPEEAKKQFELSGDKTLCELVDACAGGGASALDADIVRYYTEVENNEPARRLILDILSNEAERFAERQKEILRTLKQIKERKHGEQ